MEEVLKKVYLSPNSSAYLAGANTVYSEAKKLLPTITYKDVHTYLEKQHVYSLHKRIKRKFERNRVLANFIDQHWQADLVDLRSLKKHNKGFAWILTVVDVFSKYGFGEPLKDKKPSTVAAAFENIIKTSGRSPWNLCTDFGKEFSSTFKDLMAKYDINHFVARSPDVKAPNVERFNRTLKTRLWKHFTLKKTFEWRGILPKLLTAINNTVSTVTKLTPAEVTQEREEEVYNRVFGSTNFPKPKFKYNVGDYVRITKEKGVFGKGYIPNFTEEVFSIKECVIRHPPVYRLQDLHGEEITGIFYNQELSKAYINGRSSL